MKNAIILCSGGIDSVTTAHYVKKKLNYEKIIILFFDYGQRNLLAERKYSRSCAREINAKFNEIKLEELSKFSTSLLNKNKKVKKMMRNGLKNTKKESEKWYVPCRNLIFLSYAMAFAESLYLKNKIKNEIFIGFKNEGKEFYLDTTSDFLDLLNKISKTSAVGKFNIEAPLIKKDKEDIILFGKKLGVNYKKTFSCYARKKEHCGTCLACRLRQEGFYWANLEDPTKYKAQQKNKP